MCKGCVNALGSTRSPLARQTAAGVCRKNATSLPISAATASRRCAGILSPQIRSRAARVAAASLEPALKSRFEGGAATKAAAKIVGEAVAERALAKGIDKVVFDRNRYEYHGRVKAVAEGARKAGLKF